MSNERYKLKPAPGRVVVKVIQPSEISEHGIIMSANNPQPPTSGEVIAVCDPYELDGDMYDPLWRVGDLVVFGQYVGTSVEIGRDRVMLIREKDIQGRLVPDKGEDALDIRQVRVSNE